MSSKEAQRMESRPFVVVVPLPQSPPTLPSNPAAVPAILLNVVPLVLSFTQILFLSVLRSKQGIPIFQSSPRLGQILTSPASFYSLTYLGSFTPSTRFGPLGPRAGTVLYMATNVNKFSRPFCVSTGTTCLGQG